MESEKVEQDSIGALTLRVERLEHAVAGRGDEVPTRRLVVVDHQGTERNVGEVVPDGSAEVRMDLPGQPAGARTALLLFANPGEEVSGLPSGVGVQVWVDGDAVRELGAWFDTDERAVSPAAGRARSSCRRGTRNTSPRHPEKYPRSGTSVRMLLRPWRMHIPAASSPWTPSLPSRPAVDRGAGNRGHRPARRRGVARGAARGRVSDSRPAPPAGRHRGDRQHPGPRGAVPVDGRWAGTTERPPMTGVAPATGRHPVPTIASHHVTRRSTASPGSGGSPSATWTNETSSNGVIRRNTR